ncbi:MAG TPA: RnfABCDGE type electron transport complex subunit D [Vicinamibacterales bacterium]
MRRFFLKTSKGLLTIVLAILIAIGAWQEGPAAVASRLSPAIVGAGLLDAAILRLRQPRWQFPSGAVLTAMIVGMVLSTLTPWYVILATSVAGVCAKYLLRTRGANVFNPAALGIVVLSPIFHPAQNWWGGLPGVHPLAQLAVPAGGVFIAHRVNKLPLVVAFLGFYFALFTLAAFGRDPAWVSEIFRTPDLQAALYFAFFILTDPPTSPILARDQIVFAAIAAIVSFATFEWSGAVYYLLAGVLAGNLWEARRRVVFRSRRAAPSGDSRITSRFST